MNQHLQPASSVTQLVFKNTEGTSEGIIERITAINYSPKILISGIEFLYFTFNLPWPSNFQVLAHVKGIFFFQKHKTDESTKLDSRLLLYRPVLFPNSVYQC